MNISVSDAVMNKCQHCDEPSGNSKTCDREPCQICLEQDSWRGRLGWIKWYLAPNLPPGETSPLLFRERLRGALTEFGAMLGVFQLGEWLGIIRRPEPMTAEEHRQWDALYDPPRTLEEQRQDNAFTAWMDHNYKQLFQIAVSSESP